MKIKQIVRSHRRKIGSKSTIVRKYTRTIDKSPETQYSKEYETFTDKNGNNIKAYESKDKRDKKYVLAIDSEGSGTGYLKFDNKKEGKHFIRQVMRNWKKPINYFDSNNKMYQYHGLKRDYLNRKRYKLVKK